jgi:ADP-ribosyl-[dinitrogen reductase] hydrolase
MERRAVTETFGRGDRIEGSLIGGAIGDALGAATEFESLSSIRRLFGPDGLTDFATAYGAEGRFTDDTQMTLFTAEGLIRAADDTDRVVSIWQAYLRWLGTQSGRSDGSVSGLAAEAVLRQLRAPGNTCLGALRGGVPGTVAEPVNDSKGCGGVMRVAPVGLVASNRVEAWELGCAAAALTHGHPSGWAPAGAFAVMVWSLCEGGSLPEGIAAGRDALADEPAAGEALAWLDRGITLGTSGCLDAEGIDAFGQGWTGDEALAIAVACVLAEPDPHQCLLLAVNHSGDSDSTGSIVGQMLGAAHGPHAFARQWRERVEAADLLVRVAADLHALVVDEK